MLLERLKTETATRHRKIEKTLDLLRPDVTRAHWAALVGRLYGFYQPWEAEIERAVRGGELAAFVADRRKVPWLESDLADLGITAAALPRCTRIPPLHSAAQVLGSMYVLEGATLGGQFIARHVEKTLGLAGGRGYSFFRSYGEATGRMWQAFRATLSSFAPASDANTIVESACETFDRLHNWLADGQGERLTCP